MIPFILYKGGFAAFYNKYEDLCEKSVNIMPPSSATFPRKRSLLSRKPGPFTCPTPIIETAGVNPFFSNIRQNIELSSGITETIPIRLPEFDFDKSKIPAFMREVIGEGGKMKLAEAFHVSFIILFYFFRHFFKKKKFKY